MANIADPLTGFQPMRVELPLDGLEAFRLASFNIEYVPQYGEIRVDQHAHNSRWFSLSAEPYKSKAEADRAWMRLLGPRS